GRRRGTGRWLPPPVMLVVIGAAFALASNLATNTVQVPERWRPVVWIVAVLLVGAWAAGVWKPRVEQPPADAGASPVAPALQVSGAISQTLEPTTEAASQAAKPFEGSWTGDEDPRGFSEYEDQIRGGDSRDGVARHHALRSREGKLERRHDGD